MSLKATTLAIVEQYQSAHWFCRIGQKVIDSGQITVPIILLSSWDEVRKHSDEKWEWLLNEFSNLYRQQLVKVAKDEFVFWNERIRAVKQVSKPLVKFKIIPLGLEPGFAAELESNLHWIVMMTLMEAEYSHVAEVGNHGRMSFWIINGHVPCGWKGEWPEGSLVVF